MKGWLITWMSRTQQHAMGLVPFSGLTFFLSFFPFFSFSISISTFRVTYLYIPGYEIKIKNGQRE